ncbi:MAG: hypothetical protein IKF24_02080, partial [Eubacterium sp.]|nr:hypothetical protein [Eubacterium sp.]
DLSIDGLRLDVKIPNNNNKKVGINCFTIAIDKLGLLNNYTGDVFGEAVSSLNKVKSMTNRLAIFISMLFIVVLLEVHLHSLLNRNNNYMREASFEKRSFFILQKRMEFNEQFFAKLHN